MKCGTCGYEITDSQPYCPRCGQPSPISTIKQVVLRVVSAIVLLFSLPVAFVIGLTGACIFVGQRFGPDGPTNNILIGFAYMVISLAILVGAIIFAMKAWSS